jgi:hypothetical protein
MLESSAHVPFVGDVVPSKKPFLKVAVWFESPPEADRIHQWVVGHSLWEGQDVVAANVRGTFLAFWGEPYQPIIRWLEPAAEEAAAARARYGSATPHAVFALRLMKLLEDLGSLQPIKVAARAKVGITKAHSADHESAVGSIPRWIEELGPLLVAPLPTGARDHEVELLCSVLDWWAEPARVKGTSLDQRQSVYQVLRRGYGRTDGGGADYDILGAAQALRVRSDSDLLAEAKTDFCARLARHVRKQEELDQTGVGAVPSYPLRLDDAARAWLKGRFSE